MKKFKRLEKKKLRRLLNNKRPYKTAEERDDLSKLYARSYDIQNNWGINELGCLCRTGEDIRTTKIDPFAFMKHMSAALATRDKQKIVQSYMGFVMKLEK